MLEKKFRAISPQAFTSNGDNTGKFTVSDSKIFKVEQIALLRADGEDNLLAVIRDIPDGTTILVGPFTENTTTRKTPLDITAFTTSKNSTIETSLQVRPPVSLQDVERYTYEESPTVARRVFLVDVCGKGYDDLNPLPVEATLTESKSENVTRYRIAYSTSDVEQSQVLPTNTKKLYITTIGDSVQKSAKMRISFTLNGTTTGNDYTTVKKGNSYFREGLSLIGKTLYFQTDKSGVTVEIEAWF